MPGPVLLLPVKPPGVGKSRLAPMPGRRRTALALAFALDTLAAVRAAAGIDRVVVLTADREVAEQAGALGAEVAADGAPGDLNLTLRLAGGALESGQRVVALCADLPAVRGADLEAALATLPPAAPAFVRDAAGAGTTTYAAPAALFRPAFGPDSARRHTAAGAVEIGADLPRLRTDVDDPDDLRRAVELGVGEHTRRALAG